MWLWLTNSEFIYFMFRLCSHYQYGWVPSGQVFGFHFCFSVVSQGDYYPKEIMISEDGTDNSKCAILFNLCLNMKV